MRLPSVALLVLVACGNDIKIADDTPDPAIRFVVPVDGAAFDPLEPVVICAELTGGREPFDVSLASDQDGVLATTADFGEGCAGGNLALEVTLTDGDHVLEISATDGRGRQASDAIELHPTPNEVPSCDITLPVDGSVVQVGAPVQFAADVSDEDGRSLHAVIDSSLDGVVFDGAPSSGDQLVTPLVGLSGGDHRLTLTLSDARGAEGSCRVDVTVAECLDEDGDGFTTCENDCDDADDGVAPDQPEVTNGIDDDCDGLVDEGTPLYDDDGDGFSEVDGDCDDADDTAYPGAPEVADDGIDQDCNGDDTVTCYADGDGDGYGTPATVLGPDGDCSDPGESSVSNDCDDGDDATHPGAFEILNDGVDQDCNGTDEVGCYADTDDDGYGSAVILPSPDGDCLDFGETATGGDCDDTDDRRYPGAAEVPEDGVDQDCNGTDTVRCRDDADEDGFGTTTIVLAADGDCTDPGEATTTTDCDGTDATVYPGAPETPDDGIDQDCSGSDARTCQLDADFDGFGSAGTVISADADCADPGESTNQGDCNDLVGTVFPGAPEVADDGVDQDCNGEDTVTCRVDADHDGWGSATIVLAADGDCTSPGEAATSTDCDDSDPGRNPGEIEIPGDGIDQDCSGADLVECWQDTDLDGFGDDLAPTLPAADGDCADPGESAIAGDCDDGDPNVNPAASDVWGDGLDTDCDGIDGADLDGDGYAAAFSGGPDCDDGDPDVNPGATEIRDTIDDDCDGSCDEGLIAPGDLVITELMINPNAVLDEQGEWIELKNTTATDIALCSGWRLFDSGVNSLTVADPTLVVPSGGYVVLAANGTPAQNGGVVADHVYVQALLQLGNGGDDLSISFDGTTIDAFAWSSAFDPTGASMQVRSGLETRVGNDLESNWCASTTPLSGGDFGTPGAAPDCP